MIHGIHDVGFWENKSVLITGGSGFLGSAFVRSLYGVVGELNVLIREQSDLYRLSSVLDKVNLRKVVLDGSEAISEQLMDARVRPDFIFHLAETYNTSKQETKDYLKAQTKSLQMLVNVLDFGRQVGTQRIVHACSSTIYGASDGKEFSEASEMKPTSTRGLIKLAERNLCKYYAEQLDTPVVLGRIFRAYGPYDSGKRLITKALDSFYQGRPVSLVSDKIKRDYIYTEDIVRCFLKMSTSSLKYGEEINIGSGNQSSARQIIEMLGGLLGEPIEVSESKYPLSTIDKDHWVADISKAKELLDWTPKISLAEGMENVVSWYSQYRSTL